MDEKSKPEESKSETVGYGKPPEVTRFRKGRSGNSKGRPKGALNMATVLQRALLEKVIINENGKRKIVSKLQASVTQLTNKAASGDLKALQLLTALVRAAEERASEGIVPNSVAGEADEKVVLGILKRIEAIHKEEQEDENENEPIVE